MKKFAQIIHIASLMDKHGEHACSDAVMLRLAAEWESVFRDDLGEDLPDPKDLPSVHEKPSKQVLMTTAKMIMKEYPDMPMEKALELAADILSPIKSVFDL